MGQQIPLTCVDLNPGVSRNEIKTGQSALFFSSVFPLMTAVNPLCPHFRWIWLFPCSFMGHNYLYISSSPSLELWHIWPGLTVGFFHFHPWCLCCVRAALAHLPATPKPQSSSPGLISPAGSAHKSIRAPFPPCWHCALFLSCPAFLTTPLSLPHPCSEHDSGQHFHCFNPAQVTCMTDLSWAPSTPLEHHCGVLGIFSPEKWALEQEEKGKTIPELLS